MESFLISQSPMLITILAWSVFVYITRRSPQQPEGVCLSCGYDLKGNFTGHCPECATMVGKTESPLVEIDQSRWDVLSENSLKIILALVFLGLIALVLYPKFDGCDRMGSEDISRSKLGQLSFFIHAFESKSHDSLNWTDWMSQTEQHFEYPPDWHARLFDGWGNQFRCVPFNGDESIPAIYSIGKNGIDKGGYGDDLIKVFCD